jgi:hypothetical protein
MPSDCCRPCLLRSNRRTGCSEAYPRPRSGTCAHGRGSPGRLRARFATFPRRSRADRAGQPVPSPWSPAALDCSPGRPTWRSSPSARSARPGSTSEHRVGRRPLTRPGHPPPQVLAQNARRWFSARMPEPPRDMRSARSVKISALLRWPSRAGSACAPCPLAPDAQAWRLRPPF